MNKFTLAVACVTLAVAAAALAQTPAPATSSSTKPAHTQFRSLDKNRDGRISRDEVKSVRELSASFAALDTDHDGYLSEAEYNRWKATPSPHTAPASDKPAGAPLPVHPDGVTAPASDADKSTSSPKDSGATR